MTAGTTLQPLPKRRLSTGTAGLDAILGGGIESDRVYLIEGTSGTGKTTLALRFLLEGVQQGDNTLLITLSESEPELRAIAASHGWDLGGIDIYELATASGMDGEAEQSVLHPAELELGETARAVMARVKACSPARVVFDSLSEIRLLAENPQRYRRQVLALKHFFGQQGCTVMLLDDRAPEALGGSSDGELHSLAHGVVTLEQVALDFGAERRRLRIKKMRGSPFSGGYHDFTIQLGGLAVYPRLVASQHHSEFNPAMVSTGSAGLDMLLGGGLNPGTNTLLVGPTGVGKTTTAVTALFAALRRGERTAYFLFDEGLPILIARTATLGMDLRPFIGNGQLNIRQIDPAEMSPGEFAHHVRAAVEDEAGFIIIDSLNAYLRSMPGENYLLLQMHELLTYLNQQGVITLVVLGQHGTIGHQVTAAVDLSYLADCIVLLRYFEAGGEVRKAISIMKSRTMSHEATVRELSIGSGGISVGALLKGMHGVLDGVPGLGGPVLPLANESA